MEVLALDSHFVKLEFLGVMESLCSWFAVLGIKAVIPVARADWDPDREYPQWLILYLIQESTNWKQSN